MTQAKPLCCKWQPIETAPRDREVLVCDTHDGKPYTVARVQWRDGAWCYTGCAEEIDFLAQFWIDRGGDRNPFHLLLPESNPPASDIPTGSTHPIAPVVTGEGGQ